MSNFRLALAQINCTMGDVAGNCGKIRFALNKARARKVNLLAFPEMVLTGYPPEDLLFKPSFIQKNLDGLKDIIPDTHALTTVVGFIDSDEEGIYNAATVLADSKQLGIYRKICLPNYGVFDEKRYFKEGNQALLLVVSGVRVGICICEDLWLEEGPIATLVNQGGAQIILVINASPYHAGKWKLRQEVIRQQAQQHDVIVAYCNMVGGQDELVFDGHSLVYDQKGELLAQGYQFQEDFVVLDIDKRKLRSHYSNELCSPKQPEIICIESPVTQVTVPPISPTYRSLLVHLEEIYQALLLGIRDYTRKNGFEKVIIGLSGGIDSALTTTLTVDALGRENVNTIFMPSQYSADESAQDSHQLAKNLGVNLLEIPIKGIFDNYLTQLAPHFEGCRSNIAEENIQARIRGNLLMALSNKFGWLVLTTGNKSEMSVGYATLYGDMAGGFAVIKDVFKTLVYQLAEYRNSCSSTPVIPLRILTKAPSAELAEGQKDTDSLPPYDVLDPILASYVEGEKSAVEIIKMGFDAQMVKRVIGMVDRSEYKRRQAPIGIRITPKAFGKDRRLPITNCFKP